MSGMPPCQEYSSAIFDLPTSQPIATDWQMFYVTSSVNGIKAAPQTPTQNCLYLSKDHCCT